MIGGISLKVNVRATPSPSLAGTTLVSAKSPRFSRRCRSASSIASRKGSPTFVSISREITYSRVTRRPSMPIRVTGRLSNAAKGAVSNCATAGTGPRTHRAAKATRRRKPPFCSRAFIGPLRLRIRMKAPGLPERVLA